MATEGLVAAGATAALGALRGDLRGTADLLIKLACAACNSIGRCQAMADKVKMVKTALESSSYSHEHKDEIIAQVQANTARTIEEIKQLVKGQEPVEYLTAVQGVVTVGEALAGDYMISATLTDNSSSVSRKVILVQSHETKKEVAILEKLSLHECILELLGIFPYGESKP
ncbi:hypothetical protein SELMODRAFT_425067 [Selaginella moellendorffii]|uniref:Uncharacterized protein n=1 Tax=Selaginella moellendorffii TaxID=88036 RepID=D8SRX4_SELML|nr:hypothetical protein SELMODRAFT_425067 [Selaginella moellendorffii]